ncbi:o-succinylbenzoate synthase [Hymenobacter aerilatus]|uniref:O-succinylbenzoate synthase n=1 Tax=Hymenobacter aerilatus TaxID=2932251 RepID=A0A8T9SQI8_9BACT|nr:o-succinylbenzoate synthase [Hymenobacter aerilatus]UOR03611.1 o-succinylbenzoate synthase [Hymenobacter aerilatus]
MLTLRYSRRPLRFKFPARTSRGALTEHVAWYLHVHDTTQPHVVGLGEAAPLAGLSPDYDPRFEAHLQALCAEVNRQALPALLPDAAHQWVGEDLPALRFALETALLDLQHGGRRLLYDTSFSRGEVGLPINGLVWMGDAAFMREQIQKKLAEGYTCLKLKIGSLDFATELQLLREIRTVAGPEVLTLRVDANGAFTPANALAKLEALSEFALHSIEQPIAAGQWSEMARICRESPVPVALDEELIGVPEGQETALLTEVRPAYVILKPTLLGGLQRTLQWMQAAGPLGIGWWLTSALESNVGLNAISQFAGHYVTDGFPQGLGTGQLYHNNVAAPLHIREGALHYNPQGMWEMPG